MVMGRTKHLHLLLMLGISLFIPLFLSYSLYVDLSGAVLLSSDMNIEDSGDEDLSAGQNEFKVFTPSDCFTLFFPGIHFGRESSCFFSPLLKPHLHNISVLRC